MEPYLIEYNRVLTTIGKYRVVDLYPYKVQDAKKFIHRDHIPYNKDSIQSKAYAKEVWRRIVEGHWVMDGDTPVYMINNTYFHINLGTISKEDDHGNRLLDYPDFRDNELIFDSYILCCDRFSGFEGDKEFTCNYHIQALERGEKVPTKVLARLEATCKRPDGQWKRYINPWDYLTVFYLIIEKREKTLGLPLYQNASMNGIFLGSRRSAKTVNLAKDTVRNFITNGARRYNMLKRNLQVNFFVGASDSLFVNSYLAAAQDSWRHVPGAEKGGISPFFREAVGPWNQERDPIIQGYRTAGGEIEGSNSMIAKAVLVPGKGFSVVSKRYLRIVNDEFGLQPNSQQIMKAADASLKADKDPSGSFFGSGTGGNIKAVNQTKGIFYDPRQFRVFSIPNYWGDHSDIGLFVSAAYCFADQKNENGMTNLVEATKYILGLRNVLSGGDESKITDLRSNEPLIPSEMFLSGGNAYFNIDVINDRIDLLESGLWKEKAKIYDLDLGKKLPDKSWTIKAVEVKDRWHNVIDSDQYLMPNGKAKTGELVVYEEPRPDGPGFDSWGSMYKVVYDPHQELPSGESYASIIVYKGVPKHRSLERDEMFYNIVASYKGRISEDDEHKMFMLLCLWYRCFGQYERMSGIRGFFRRNELVWLLQPTPYNTIKEISPGTTQRQSTGIIMTDNGVDGLKSRALGLLKTWHNSVIFEDEEMNDRKFIQIETVWCLSLLYEMGGFNFEGNFDDISAMRILMLWLKEEQTNPDKEEDAESSDAEDRDMKELLHFTDLILDR